MKIDYLRMMLKGKLKEEGRTQKWFVKKYLPDMRYNTANCQIYGYNAPTDKVIKAIKKYLEE